MICFFSEKNEPNTFWQKNVLIKNDIYNIIFMLYPDIWNEILPFIQQNMLLLLLRYKVSDKVIIYISNFQYNRLIDIYARCIIDIIRDHSILKNNVIITSKDIHKQNNIKLLILNLEYNNITNLNDDLYYAAINNNMRFIKYLIKLSSNNRTSIFRALFSKNVKIYSMNINYGLRGACYGRHIRIVKYMIKRGANEFDNGLYNACRNNACRGNHIKIINMMIQKGANVNYGLYGACIIGNMNIIKLMISLGASNWNSGLFHACKYSLDYDNRKVILSMIQKGADHCGSCNRSIYYHLEKYFNIKKK